MSLREKKKKKESFGFFKVNSNQIYVPKEFMVKIIRDSHSHGHFGVRKVFASLHKSFFTPTLKDLIAAVVKSCESCIVTF
jgi:hypothetical protein